MNENDYLNDVLKSQDLDSDGKEMKDLQKHRQEVEELLLDKFSDASPTIRYGGSKAKGTMIKELYDLDIVCYIPHDKDSAGKSLKEIYDNAYSILSEKYYVERRGSALRLKDRDPQNYGVDFHIDVVPGRYVDDTKTDVFLHRSSGDKEYLKTNLDVHIKHIKDSGVVDTIRLIKLWKFRNAVSIKNFVLELLVIDVLRDHKKKTLANQLKLVWEEFQDNYQNLSVEDPANPTGNDLSEDLNEMVRNNLQQVAETTLTSLEKSGWEIIFGSTEEISLADKVKTLSVVAGSINTPVKPYYYD